MRELNDPNKLFRKEALDYMERQNDGQVIIIRPLSFTIMTTGVCIFLILLLVFLIFAGYTRNELAKGTLIPDGEFAKVYTFKPGVIKQVFVAEGDLVEQGDDLFILEANQYNGTGENTTEFVKQELEKAISLHQQGIDREKRSNALELEHIKQSIAYKKNALEHSKKLINSQSEKVEALKKEYLGLDKLLKKGLISSTEFNNKYSVYIDSIISLDQLRADTDNLERDIQDLEYQLKRTPYQLEERISSMELDISEAEQRLSELSASGKFAVKAPISGRVTSILGKVGAYTNNETPLLVILPDQFNLKAELYIPTRIISFVDKGQPVKVRYDAFPYQKFGYYRGYVESVSQSVLQANELHTNVKLDEPVYRVTVVLDQQTVASYGKRFPLQPGMLLEAYLEGEKRSLLEWVFEPILGVKNKYVL